MNCPICNFKNIPPKASQCPQCASDLECFKLLQSLPDQTGPSPQRPAVNINMPLIVIVVLFCLTNTLLVYQNNHVMSLVTQQQSDSNQHNERLVALMMQKNIAQDSPNENMRDKTNGEAFSDRQLFDYRVRSNDTLWGISKRFYGAGMYYPVILAHNPHIDTNSLKDGLVIRILRDGQEAQDIYAGVFSAKER